VVFVCENNLYMEYTPIAAVTAVRRPAADRAASYGLEAIVVDGNDADAMHDIAVTSLRKARAGEGPVLIEALTYRHGGHSRADPAKYRPQEEVDAWMARDPIPMYRLRLLDSGVSEPALADIEREVATQVDEATEAAKAASPPGAELLMADVWADGGASWRN
jgi:acetoin:2,6-dichlorophenolindophenol oxidoreductase subunit alpha